MYWLAQVTGWLGYGLIILLAAYASSPERLDWRLVVNLVCIVFFAILFTHLMRLCFFKLGWLEMKLAPLIPRILIISLICSFLVSLSSLAAHFLTGQHKNPDDQVTPLLFFIDIIGNSILILFWNAIYFTYHFFTKSRKQELDNISLEASKNEFELKNLRSQLNPHFLFNSLNSIRALIDIEPGRAKHSVTVLSQLLRNSLQMGKETSVTVEQEMGLVSRYLELEKIRFEERLSVQLDLDDSISEHTIPPFVIQAQVENAIKHGISKRIDGGEIGIRTYREHTCDVFEVINSGTLTSRKSGNSGIGLENTRKRLWLQYRDKATFSIREANNQVITQIKIDRL